MDWMPVASSGREMQRVEELEGKAELILTETNIPAIPEPETDSSPLTKAAEPQLVLKGPCLVGRSLPVPHPPSEDDRFLSAKHKAVWVSKY